MTELDKNSLLYWYPQIKNLPIKQPRTEIYMIPEELTAGDIQFSKIANTNAECLDYDAIAEVADKIGYPLFCRTDQASAKHFWKDACYIPNRESLKEHIYRIIDFNLMAGLFGLEFRALVFREFIPMDSKFTAFEDMPINTERRYFVQKGKVICGHPYWIEEAVAEGNPKLENWREVLKQINADDDYETTELTAYAKVVGIAEKLIEDDWSVDFCKTILGEWVLIDMALAGFSWHPKDCVFYRRFANING